MNDPAKCLFAVRRRFLKSIGAAAAAAAGILEGCGGVAPLLNVGHGELLPKNARRVVVVGGGYGGAIAAKYIRMLDPSLEVVLVERNRQFISCPFSNLVIGGIRQMDDLTIGYERLAVNHGIRLIHDEVIDVDAAGRRVVLASGTLKYDRLILAPGIDFRYAELEGYDSASTPQVMPHAWKAGAQTELLRGQLRDMRDGGSVVLTVPLTPFRCPPGPYERASMVAMYLKRYKPKSKVIVLDANPDIVSKGALFRKGWARHYPGMIDYRGGQRVTAVNAQQRSVLVEGIEEVAGDVVNVIPPQRAGAIAVKAGVVGAGHWCPIDPTTFESKLVSDIHVIGDACAADAMPKSGYSANSQAKVCAMNVVALLNGHETVEMSAINVCYSFITEKEAVSIAAVYRMVDGKIVAVPNSGGVSPDLSELEAAHAENWRRNILAEMSI